MSTTLILSDVVFAVRGDGNPSDVEQRLGQRVAALSETPAEEVEAWLGVLAPEAPDGAAVEVLESALILSLAFPEQAAAHKLGAVVHGRRLAAAYERAEDSDSAFAVLRVVAEAVPGNASVERATAALMRRQGMVQELVDRYLERAQRLLDDGEHQAAIPWLREVLQIDRSRKDVARMIRDLRFDEEESRRARKRRLRVAAVALLFSLALTLLALREARIAQDAAGIPVAARGDLSAMRARLDAIEGFVAAHPVWHGALGMLQERSRLRVEIDRLTEEAAARERREAEARRRRDDLAEKARVAGRRAAQEGDFEAALGHFQRALEQASDSWAHRARLERDVEAIREHLQGEDR